MSAFDKIKAGLEDAIAYAEGDASRGQVAAPNNAREVRRLTGKTQAQFASAYRVPVGTLRDWEQQRRQPDAPARVLLSIIQRDPEGVARLVSEATAALRTLPQGNRDAR